jgi:hypothetical protein
MALINAIAAFINNKNLKVVEKAARRDGHNFARFGQAHDFRTSAFYKNTYRDLALAEAYDKAFQEPGKVITLRGIEQDRAYLAQQG